MLDSLLDQLARRRGLGEAYHDYRGELRPFSAATKTAILAAMGCKVTDAGAVERELAELDEERWRSLLPPVSVIRPGRTAVVVALPAEALAEPVEWLLRMADGTEIAGRVLAASSARSSVASSTDTGSPAAP